MEENQGAKEPAPVLITLGYSSFTTLVFAVAGGRLYVVLSELICRALQRHVSGSTVANLCSLLWMDPGVRMDGLAVVLLACLYFVFYIVKLRRKTSAFQLRYLFVFSLLAAFIFLASNTIVATMIPLQFW